MKNSYKENIQNQMEQISTQLVKLRSSKHVLNGYKAWNVFDVKQEALQRELEESMKECQRILQLTLNRSSTDNTESQLLEALLNQRG
jgi:hypothetical protein